MTALLWDLKEASRHLGGWATLGMVLRYAHLGADHLARTRRADRKTQSHPHKFRRSPKKRIGEKRGKSLIKMVARDGIEPSTRGFSVRCSTN